DTYLLLKERCPSTKSNSRQFHRVGRKIVSSGECQTLYNRNFLERITGVAFGLDFRFDVIIYREADSSTPASSRAAIHRPFKAGIAADSPYRIIHRKAICSNIPIKAKARITKIRCIIKVD